MTDRVRRSLVHLSLFVGAAPWLTACGGGGGDDDLAASPTPSPPPPAGPPATSAQTFAVFADPGDPRILQGDAGDGERFVLYGAKEASGIVQRADELQFVDAAFEVRSVRFDRDSTRIEAVDGGSLASLTRGTGDSLVFGLVAGERQLQIALPGTAAASASMPEAAGRARVGSLGLTLAPQPGCDCGAGQARALAVSTAVNAPIVQVNVSGCAGTSPAVRVVMRDETGKVLDVVTGKTIGNGSYLCRLTQLNTGDEAVAEAAQAAITFLEHFDISQGAFLSIFNQVKSKGIGSVVDEVIASLQAAGKEADTIEEFASFLNLTDEDVTEVQKRAKLKMYIGARLKLLFKSIDVFDKLFAAVLAGDALSKFIDAYGQVKFNQLQLQPQVTTAKGDKFTGESSGLIAPAGPYPDLSVHVPGQTEVSALSLTPAQPGAGTPYVAQGTVSCVTAGDLIVIAVTGSDGYADSAEQTVSSGDTQTILLNVPGAETGVRDTVTVRVLRAGQALSSRSAILIFG